MGDGWEGGGNDDEGEKLQSTAFSYNSSSIRME